MISNFKALQTMTEIIAKPVSDRGDPTFSELPFSREAFGDRLHNFVKVNRSGAVIAIDAPWGFGKTTFIKMWKKKVSETGSKVVYFDAFANDYADDPFVPIVGTLSSFIQGVNENSSEEFRGKIDDFKATAGAFAAALAMSTFSNALTVATGGLVTADDVFNAAEAPTNGETSLNENFEKSFALQLECFEQQSVRLEKLRSALSKAALSDAEDREPIIFIIDELDRCNPKFALALLERIKHIFNVPGIVFMLVLNADYLERCVNHQYRNENLSEGYLSKFLHWSFPLPPIEYETDYVLLVEGFFVEFDSDIETSVPMRFLSEAAWHFKMSHRETERLCSLVLVICSSKHFPDGSSLLISILTSIQIKAPEFFMSILDGEVSENSFQDFIAKYQIQEYENFVALEMFFIEDSDEQVYLRKLQLPKYKSVGWVRGAIGNTAYGEKEKFKSLCNTVYQTLP